MGIGEVLTALSNLPFIGHLFAGWNARSAQINAEAATRQADVTERQWEAQQEKEAPNLRLLIREGAQHSVSFSYMELQNRGGRAFYIEEVTLNGEPLPYERLELSNVPLQKLTVLQPGEQTYLMYAVEEGLHPRGSASIAPGPFENWQELVVRGVLTGGVPLGYHVCSATLALDS